MNIRLKRIIKIGLPLIIFFINICSAVEEENENEKKTRVIFFFLQSQGIGNPQGNIITRIENKDSYLEEYLDNESNEKKYRVREGEEELLKVAYQSLLEENKKVNLNNNDLEPECTGDCKNPDHMMTLPTCGQNFCKNVFFLHLQNKLFLQKKIISCPKYGERIENDKIHICRFSLGEVEIKKDDWGNFLGKEVKINEELSDFLEKFGHKIIGKDDGKDISLREFIKKIISEGASEKDFNTGEAKRCMYCKTTTLYKKNCIDKTNRIQCSGCGEKFICFKCLCKWDDSRIDHEKCIDSIDCDLFQEFGKGLAFVGKKDNDPNDDGFENFEVNKYYHPKRCYSCKAYMVKDRACNHATCVCGAQWCWFCGAIYYDNHWNDSENCKGLHLQGDFYKNFDPSLNARMQLKDDDLFTWERKENKISKEEIQNFINLKKPILDEIIVQEENDQLCCNCFLDCLDKIKNSFSDI